MSLESSQSPTSGRSIRSESGSSVDSTRSESVDSTASTESEESLVEEGETIFEEEDQDSQEPSRVLKKTPQGLVQDFLKGKVEAESLHPKLNPFIKFCKNHPLLVLSLGAGLGIGLGIGLFVAGLAVSGASFGAASPLGAVLVTLSLFAMTGGLACGFGAVAGFMLSHKETPEKEKVPDEERMAAFDNAIKADKNLTEEDQLTLLGLYAGKAAKKSRIDHLQMEYQAAYSLRTQGVKNLQDDLKPYTKKVGKNEKKELKAAIAKIHVDVTNYRTAYTQAVDIVAIYGSEKEKKIIERGRTLNQSDTYIWNQIKKHGQRLEGQQRDLKEDPDKRIAKGMGGVMGEVFKEANAAVEGIGHKVKTIKEKF